MGIIAWIILGLLAGTIARAVIPGRTEPGGCIGTTAIGSYPLNPLGNAPGCS